MAEVDFSDEESAKAWFAKHSKEKQSVLSFRAAMRALIAFPKPNNRTSDLDLLHVYRALIQPLRLNSHLQSDKVGKKSSSTTEEYVGYPHTFDIADRLSKLTTPSDEGFELTQGAASSALAAATAMMAANFFGIWKLGDSANGATRRARAALALRLSDPAILEAADDALFADSLESEEKLWTQPLWPSEPPPAVVSLYDAVSNCLSERAAWSFWRRWYQEIWEGTFKDWELAFEVARLPDHLWEGSDALEKVAEAIREIERDLKSRVGPRLVKNADRLFDLEDDVTIGDEPIAFAIGQVEIALRAALSGDANNGFKENSDEAVLIQTACTEYRDQHSNVATAFWNACMGLQHNIGTVYPDDRSLISLQNTLYVSVEEMCQHSALIRDRIARLAALETKRYPIKEEREELRKLPEIVSEDMTERANEELAKVVERVTEVEKPARVWRAKLVNWLNTLSKGIDQGQKTEKKANWLLNLARKIGKWFFDDDNPDVP